MLKIGQRVLSVESEEQGADVYKFTLRSESLLVEVTNIGCGILSIYTKGRDGVQKNIVAGFSEIADYRDNREYFGCVLGRYANRIAGGRFMLKGEEIRLSVNDRANHLHGGIEGFNKKIWKIGSLIREEERVGVVFEYLSRDGEEGYPGNLRVKVKYVLNNKDQLQIEYEAETDKATPVNLSNHSYFNLTGFETATITGHSLVLSASRYTEKNRFNIPTGRILPVAGTWLDFRRPQKFGVHIGRLIQDQGFDHNFILEKSGLRGRKEGLASEAGGEPVFAALLSDPVTGRTLRMYTSQPAIQVYTANWWDGTITGQQGQVYQKHGAVALETQAFPDSPNHENFPNTILAPGERYFSTTIYEFGVEG